MLRLHYIYILVFFFLSYDVCAQAIYGGGSGDGFGTSCYTQANNSSLNIYIGGNSDGFATACYSQADNVSFDLYKGGSADGFATACYSQADNVSFDLYKGGSFGGFSIGCRATVDGEALPIELISFTGICENKNVFLKWITATETNNDYFSIERSLADVKWRIIGKVKGAGKSSTIRNYTFVDNVLSSELRYYRLKQTDFDGKFEYFNIIAIENCEEAADFIIYPNPSKGIFTLSFYGNIEQFRSIEIYNILGEKIFYSENYQSTINLSNHANGMYFVHYNLCSESIIKKIIIEH